MVSMNMDKVPLALADFLDQRVMTALDSNSPYRWIIGGASTLVLSRFQEIVKTYTPILRALGLLDENGRLMIEIVERFITSAFDKQPNMRLPIMGVPFNFNKDDGQVLIELLKQRGL